MPSSYVPEIGGVQLNTHRLAKQLLRMGQEIEVLTKAKTLPRRYTVEGISILALPFYLFRGSIKSLFGFLFSLAVCLAYGINIFHRQKPEVVNIHFLGANAFFYRFFTSLKRARLVITLHGGLEAPKRDLELTEGYWEARILNRTARRMLQRANTIICISRYVRDKVADLMPELKDKCMIIPIGVDPSRSEALVRKRRGFILGAGRLSHEKGFDVLIKAFRSISEEFPESELIIAGEGEEQTSLDSLVKDMALRDKVRFLGGIDQGEVRELLRQCAMCVVPSRIESFGSIILEAMAEGAPVIGTSCGGIPEIIEDGKTGFLVPADNAPELARAIKHLLRNPEVGAAVAGKAREEMAGKYDWAMIAEQYLGIYQRIPTN